MGIALKILKESVKVTLAEIFHITAEAFRIGLMGCTQA